jgi:hypothetical protein
VVKWHSLRYLRYLWSVFGGKKEEVDPTAGMSREVRTVTMLLPTLGNCSFI